MSTRATADYRYNATVIRVVDGDTVDALVDVGFDVGITMKLRLMGINAPELRTDEGKAARTFLLGVLGFLPSAVVIATVKDHTEKYGRYLATIYRAGENVNDMMISSGNAVPYMPSLEEQRGPVE